MSKSSVLIDERIINVYGNTEFLSAAEETELSKRIQAGETAKEMLQKRSDLKGSEIDVLLTNAEDGNRAYERLVLANLPRADKFAAEAFRKNPDSLNDYEDYRQSAIKAICACARTYDWRRGSRFGTYVHRCLINEMLRENSKNCFAMRIPEENLSKLGELRRLSAAHSIGEAAKELGMECSDAEKLLSAGKYRRNLQDPANTNDPGAELGDLIEDDTVMSADEIEAEIDLRESIRKLHEALAILPEAEKSLLTGRAAAVTVNGDHNVLLF